MSYLSNLIVDLLSTHTFRGDLINWLPAKLRQKARANQKARTVIVARTSRGTAIYRTLTAKEWSKRS